MYSLENFYYILYTNLLKPAKIHIGYFLPFGSTRMEDERTDFPNASKYGLEDKTFHIALCYDQEPLLHNSINLYHRPQYNSNKFCKLLANSEHSALKKEICRNDGYIDWYYFYHGFAALDWYRDYQYLSLVEHQFTKVFISLNRLVTKDRSYRLLLVSKMLEQDLVKHGHVSLSLEDHGFGSWQDEVNDPTTKLPQHQIGFIKDQIGKLPGSLVVDYANPVGSLSADAGPHELKINQSALWHIVSETIFYHDKLHLTEKIFKPIVSKRPFILIGGCGNLAYLKKYGFKTFDRWIDESYDSEPDPTRRIEMAVAELNKLCSLSMTELQAMHSDMKEVLDYNFNHLYGDFRGIIVDELVDNFQGAVAQWNNGRVDGKNVDLSSVNFESVKHLLKR